jgi:hypothetical protein
VGLSAQTPLYGVIRFIDRQRPFTPHADFFRKKSVDEIGLSQRFQRLGVVATEIDHETVMGGRAA